MRTVIFDLDGTLADTSGDLMAAANACFQAEGLGQPLDPEADKLIAFNGGRAMLNFGLQKLGRQNTADFIDAQYPRLLEHYGNNIDKFTVLYPDCIAAVDALLASDYRVGVCTNKPEGLADTLLTRLGVRDRFASLVGADTLPVRKPDAAPYIAAVERAGGAVSQSLLVGDTDTDVKTAQAAEVPVVLVGFGPEGDRVARHTPDAILPDYSQLGRIVQLLIG